MNVLLRHEEPFLIPAGIAVMGSSEDIEKIAVPEMKKYFAPKYFRTQLVQTKNFEA